jgi:hypothetical protein
MCLPFVVVCRPIVSSWQERKKKRGGTCESKRGESGTAVVPFHLGVFFVGTKVHDGACNPGPVTVTRQHVGLGKCPSRGGAWAIVEPCRFATHFTLLRKRSSLHNVYTGEERRHTKKKMQRPIRKDIRIFPPPLTPSSPTPRPPPPPRAPRPCGGLQAQTRPMGRRFTINNSPKRPIRAQQRLFHVANCQAC